VKLYRVFPYDASAADTDPGGALYVPRPSELGRIANVGLYRELYFSAQPDAAIAEVFGFLYAWYGADFIHANGSPYALASYELDDTIPIFDLDDTALLSSIGIRQPSSVVTRQRATTQAWAKTIFDLGSYAGAKWWSYYSPEWTAYGLWDFSGVRHLGRPDVLSTSHPAVSAAAATIVRQIHPRATSRGRRKP